MIRITIACLLPLLLAACQSPTGRQNTASRDTIATTASVMTSPDTTTLGGTWYLQPVLPSDTAAGKIPSLDLNLTKSRFLGNTGCNSMNGEFWFSKTDSSLSFSKKIVTSKMACQGYNEQAFIKSLLSAGRYRLQNGVLTLLSDDNTELSHWVRKPGDAPKALKA
jgi:heat shock protein HslJ